MREIVVALSTLPAEFDADPLARALIDLGLAFYAFAALTCAEPRAFSSRNYQQVRDMELVRSSG